MTLVSSTDGAIWTLRGKLIRVGNGYGAALQPLALPAGTYYIAPDWRTGSAIRFALIDAVRRVP